MPPEPQDELRGQPLPVPGQQLLHAQFRLLPKEEFRRTFFRFGNNLKPVVSKIPNIRPETKYLVSKLNIRQILGKFVFL